MKQLRYIHDHKRYAPYWEGKFNDPNRAERSEILLNLNIAWLKYHFEWEFLRSVMDLGRLKIKDPNYNGFYKLIPQEDRWMDVPLGFNNNNNEVPAESLCLSVPIAYQQGNMKTCLYTSVASALVYMGHSDSAEYIVKNMTKCVGLSAKIQWKDLTELMCNNNMIKKVHIAKFNFKRGKKRSPKHKLNVESLTSGHENAKDLHAVALIGSDGSEDHAVAVVNGMVFDSSTTHAMVLCRDVLDWCCNSIGGYARTGHAIRFKVTAKT